MGERKFLTTVTGSVFVVYFDYLAEDTETNCQERVTINAVNNLNNKNVLDFLSKTEMDDLETECFNYIDLENDWMGE